MASLDLQIALASCNYYPVHIDLRRRLIWFAEIDRETYRRAGFLVPKQARMSEERYGFNLDDVLLHDLTLPVGGAPSHYIFISAFCCSTLLARLLDRVPGCFVLREPSILGQLAMMRYGSRTSEADANGSHGQSAFWTDRGSLSPPSEAHGQESTDRGYRSSYEFSEGEDEWQARAALGMRLLTRTFEPAQTVIVKAADVCNAMPEVILANDPRSKAVLLSVGLRTFILSVLKAEDRRKWTRNRAAFWYRTLQLFPALNEVNVPALDDAGKAAYCWLVTAALWDRFQKQAEPAKTGRLLLMDGDEVSDNPGSALAKVAGFFGLPLEQGGDILADPVLSHHAKFPCRTYDAATRRNDLADWENRFGPDADRAMEWAECIQEKLEADGVNLSSMAGAERREPVLCET